MHATLAVFILSLFYVGLSHRIRLPPNTQVEGVAHVAGSLFFAGDFRRGAILLIDFATGFTTTVVPANANRLATGLTARNGSVFVAGGGIFGVFTSPPRMFVYDILSGNTVAACDAPLGALVNDVTADDDFAYYTDSFLGKVYMLRLATLPQCDLSVLSLPPQLFAPGPPFLTTNGIRRFASGLVVANSNLGSLFFVDLSTNSTQQITPNDAVVGAGGLELSQDKNGSGATLFVAQSTLSIVSIWRLWKTGKDVKARFVQNITYPEFETPGTVALGDGRLVVGDPKFETYTLTNDLPDGAELALFGFRIRRARHSK
ncbi:unnamed protein product [Agarophyton chilense]